MVVHMDIKTSKKSFPRKLNFPRRLPSFIPSLRNTDRTPLPKLNFIFLRGEGAWAVMWKMYAGEGAGAEIICAVCCRFMSALGL